MNAIILTAGEGTRMRPLTITKPKTMLQIGGKPILQYNIESLRDAGVDEITLVVGYHEEVIKDHFKDGKDIGVKISYVTQEDRLGTAHAIGSARKHVHGQFITLNGDIIVDPALITELIDGYREENARSMLVLTEVEDPSSFGVVELDGNRIIRIVEKPKKEEAPSNLINAGIYLFDDQIFDAIDQTPKSERGEYEITDSLQLQMNEDENVVGLRSTNRWIDIGRPWELLDVNEHFLKDLETDIQGEVEEGVTIHGQVFIGKNSVVRSGCYIMGPVYIGENCDIGPNSFMRKYTSVGNNVSVGNAVELKNSIIMDNTNVNHLSYVGDSIIGSNCNIAAGTNIANLRFDDGNVMIVVKNEKIDSGRRKMGVVFGDGVKTGINSSFNPGVKVGVNSRIGAGVILSKDLESNKLLIAVQEHQIIENNKSK
ncbi:Glucosamine-1-phosphate N-acetyltransferase [Methanobacterium lacus]|uniref:Bifunctional protein GlmU n=1 Tax=Methanobacterium lacus (strain AL-21) TaxID=877455 RepID=F0T600_METLA|nr:bifunctional sugar-1-phosphate nucleotidylyltransferase/acetyltransferase [Methanobacterium lacus]ADZ10507.1 Glucosamine-1-phosphate N-acetyltransferase [Methanobacterium lacus]